MKLAEPYSPRPIRFLRPESVDGWRLKVYGISYGRAEPRAALVDAAVAFARRVLPRPAVAEARYGVGFVVAHDGRGGNFALVGWWGDENELHLRVAFSTRDEPAALRDATPDDPVACAWDLRVAAFERDAWVHNVLANPAGPDLDAYLSARLNEHA